MAPKIYVHVHSNESFVFNNVHHLCYDEYNYIFELLHFNILSVYISLYIAQVQLFDLLVSHL